VSKEALIQFNTSTYKLRSEATLEVTDYG